MSNHIHLNLIKEEEIVSSSPVRTQTIAPAIMAIFVLSVLGWWVMLLAQYSSASSLLARHREIQTQLQSGYTAVQALNAEGKQLGALIAQLDAYQNSRLLYGEVFSQIPPHVSPNIQFTALEIPVPPPPQIPVGKEGAAPTNTTESARFLITGRTSGATAFAAVDQLLRALQSSQFTNLIHSAQIPKDSFRQDPAARNEGEEFLRFEIECSCTPRRFE